MTDYEKILWDDLASMFPKTEVLNIRFKGHPFLLIRSKDKGAIATQEQYENFLDSFAYLKADGTILRYGIQIGTKEDIEFCDESDNDPC